jgi:hypothetical protein
VSTTSFGESRSDHSGIERTSRSISLRLATMVNKPEHCRRSIDSHAIPCMPCPNASRDSCTAALRLNLRGRTLYCHDENSVQVRPNRHAVLGSRTCSPESPHSTLSSTTQILADEFVCHTTIGPETAKVPFKVIRPKNHPTPSENNPTISS